MDDINKIIGKNLLILRKNAKLTQMELADRFNYSDKTISKWESGESLPNIEILYELAQFYGTTLDALTQENDIVESTNNSKQKDKMFPTKLIITLLAVSAIWLLATVLFVTFKIVYAKNFPLLFLWAVPISCIVLIIFNSIWGKYYYLFAILSVLIWSTLACVHLQLIQYNIWIIYILGIPLQVAIILWAALIKKPRNSKKKKRKFDQADKPIEKSVKKTKTNKKDKSKKNIDIFNIWNKKKASNLEETANNFPDLSSDSDESNKKNQNDPNDHID